MSKPKAETRAVVLRWDESPYSAFNRHITISEPHTLKGSLRLIKEHRHILPGSRGFHFIESTQAPASTHACRLCLRRRPSGITIDTFLKGR